MMSHDCARSHCPEPGRPLQPQLVPASRKLRFAVAFSAVPGALSAIAVGLAQLGVARHNIHLVAEDETLAAASRELALGGTQVRLTEIARCMTTHETTTDYPWVLELLAASAAADGLTTRTTKLGRLDTTRATVEVTRPPREFHWAPGAGVVIVRLDHDTTERDVCNLMLRHHSTSVQTHDLRPLD